MTTPKAATTHYRANGDRIYEHPMADEPKVGDGRAHWSPIAVGVTSVLSTLNKPFLVDWAAKEAAKFAVAERDAWQALTSKTAQVDLIARTSKRVKDDAADMGTDAHHLAEAIANYKFFGGEKPEVPVELAGFAQSYLKFLREMKAEPVYLERTIWNHEYGYAGTFDGIFRLGTDPRLVMIDTKTSRSGIWPETALQQVAYKHGEVMLTDEGNEVEMPKVDEAYALWLRPEGYALFPLRTTDDEWQTFTRLVEVTRWRNDVGASAVGKPINPVPYRR